MPTSQNFGSRLKRIRETQGMTQQEFAEALGIKAHQIGDIERGRNDPSVWILASIASIFRIDPEWLLLGPAEANDTEPPAPERPSSSDLRVLRDLRKHFGREAEPRLMVAWRPADQAIFKQEDWVFVPLVAGLENINARPLKDSQVIGYYPLPAYAVDGPEGLRCVRITDNDMAPLLPEGSIVAFAWILRNPGQSEGRIVCARTERQNPVIRYFHQEPDYWILSRPAAEGVQSPHPIVVPKSAIPDPIIGTVVFAWLDMRK